MEEEYKNTKPKVTEIYNKANNSYLARSEDGKFTHPIEAEKSYEANQKKWDSLTEEEKEKVKSEKEAKSRAVPGGNDRVEMAQYVDQAFLSQKNLNKKIIKNFVKLNPGETYGELKLNDNIFTDSENKVDAYIPIYDKSGNIVDYVFIDFKHENKLMANGDLKDFDIDLAIGKWDRNGKKIGTFFNSKTAMSQVLCYGLVDSGGLDMASYIDQMANGGTPSNKMKIAMVNKNELKEGFVRAILDEKGDMDDRLDEESNDIYNIYKTIGFEELARQTKEKDGAAYFSGFECYEKTITKPNGKEIKNYEIVKKLDRDGIVNLNLKIVSGKLQSNITINYDYLEKAGIMKRADTK